MSKANYLSLSKKIAVTAALILAAVCVFTAVFSFPRGFAYAAPQKEIFVALGDSIATGYGLSGYTSEDYIKQFPSPPTSYAAIVAARGDYTLYNHARDGDATYHLLPLLKENDETSKTVQTNVAAADIIHVTIGGNDVMDYYLYSSSPFSTKQELIDGMFSAFVQIIGRLRELNPTAPIIVLKNYIPAATALWGESRTVIESYNALCEAYLLEHPYYFYYIGTASAADYGITLFDVHPSASGHQKIADFLTQAIAQYNQSPIASLLAPAKAERAALKEEIAALEEENASLGEEKTALEGENTALKEEKTALEAENAALGEENAALEEENAALEEENTAFKEENAALDGQIADVESENLSLKTYNELLGDEAADLETRFEVVGIAAVSESSALGIMILTGIIRRKKRKA
ncbi:MAG: GDSL-type esterase/lipase family protein [Clostridiales bacterium]|jgi:lysophospholipase L1-like esterase/FtsZ-binding cell division protein ZapB|nr:GDSL-type esterase/lipase family protein [Clostridiales bacterium]